jgi:hypothetical protein
MKDIYIAKLLWDQHPNGEWLGYLSVEDVIANKNGQCPWLVVARRERSEEELRQMGVHNEF